MRTIARVLVGTILLVQLVAAFRVIARLVRTGRGESIAPAGSRPRDLGSVAVIVPVLNEETRLSPCLDGLALQGEEVREILVVDGGSSDGTVALARGWVERDGRIRLIDASPVPGNWNGKPWGLHVGLEHVDDDVRWILTVDADVRPGSDLVSSLLAHAETRDLRVMSVATPQRVSGAAEAAVHTSMLASLVYRYGIPGHAYDRPDDVQANGQCFLIDRRTLQQVGGFAVVARSVVEDVTLARRCASMGIPVGFYEPDRSAAMVTVEMYTGWYDALNNWSRSLPMRDRRSGITWWMRMVDMAATQAMPVLALAVTARWRSIPFRSLVLRLNIGLVVMRLGTQAGMARAYIDLPRLHWLAVVFDPIAVTVILIQSQRREHRWRGRVVRW
ncbi:MAG TPA: glycosyltransferase family 2 protein [Thermomicrobiales bacterium]|nr:glycosyltransferase family 2 protein [Thermomicrobiales bacterium]